MSKRTALAIAAIGVSIVVVLAAYVWLFTDADGKTVSEMSMLNPTDLPSSENGSWGGGNRAAGDAVTYWYQPGMKDVMDGNYMLENTSTNQIQVLLWVILEHYNSTEQAQAGYDGLRTLLVEEREWNITEVDVGDRGFMVWDNWTDDHGNLLRISTVVFLRGDFTAILQFDLRSDYDWRNIDSIDVAGIQAGKIAMENV